MAGKLKAVAAWKEMNPRSLRRLGLSAFLMFGVLGPLSILMVSEIKPIQWNFVLVQTVAYGGLAASLVIFRKKRWWGTVLILAFWGGVLMLNSGGLSFVYDAQGLRVHLEGPGSKKETARPKTPLTLNPDELSVVYTQRGILGATAIVLLAFGYGSFVRLVRREVTERARLETEVGIARDIQQSLLPRSALKTSWCEVAGLSIPMTEVGGDYFDCIELPGERVAVGIADVTGHGIGAGILSAMTKSAFYSELEHDASPDLVLRNLNRTVHRLSNEKTFVTFAYVLLNHSAGLAAVSTGGHPPVLHREARSKKVTQLRTPSPGLGMRADGAFSRVEIRTAPGDRMLLYTDGVLELMNRQGEQFGSDRLVAWFERNDGLPEAICSGILTELHAFAKNEVFRDDVTLACISIS